MLVLGQVHSNRNVVLPTLTPPVTMMLHRLFTAAARNAASVAPMLGSRTRHSSVTSIWAVLRRTRRELTTPIWQGRLRGSGG